MNFKIDTKEKFYVIKPLLKHLSANMAEQLINELIKQSKNKPNNVIVNIEEIEEIDNESLLLLIECREKMYSNNTSFVICNAQKNIANKITEKEMEDLLNITPTESEAWDIVQMDEIEREFDAD